MQNTALSQNPYGVSDTVVRSERSIEYQAFTRVTGALTAYTRNDNAQFSDLADAVHQNRRLWNILARDVSLDENELPVELRANIFSLSQFVMRHSAQVLSGEGDIQTLIDLNKTIMRGLGKG